MNRFLAALALSLLFGACGTPATAPPATAPPAGTGIQGIVTIGPTCPVERVNSPCPPRPIAVTVIVRNAIGSEVTRFRSGADGRFKVALSPGQYVLLGQSPSTASLPRPIPVSVTVTSGSYAVVTVEFDSGIR
jgi:hypothetical protein